MNKKNLLPAMFLVAGTCIGGGMIALPVSTGMSGFLPSLVMMLIAYLAMTATGLILAEVSLWYADGAHVSSLSEDLLGQGGKTVSWLLYLFIAYGSLIAYTAEGGAFFSRVSESLFSYGMTEALGAVLFIFIFGVIVDLGATIVGRINSILFFGLILSYILMTFVGFPHVKMEHLSYAHWTYAIYGIPLMLTAFSFQTMVPSLTPYLDRDPKSLRWAIAGGTTLTFIVYLVWQFLVLGIVPAEGENGLIAAVQNGDSAIKYIKIASGDIWVSTVAEFFAFFGIVTSFLGIALGLVDFLADGLHLSKKGWGKLTLGGLVIIPTLFSAIYFEKIFLLALDATGGFGDTILNGIIPVLMLIVGRFYRKKEENQVFRGGKVVLALVMAYFVTSLSLELCKHLGLISSIFDVSAQNVL